MPKNAAVQPNTEEERDGSDFYHTLTSRHKSINNESNIVNANFGTDGVNVQYSKAEGNRGKQLNPNQKHSMTIALRESCSAFLFSHKNKDGVDVGTRVNFKEEFLDKGLIEKIGARKIGDKERADRNFKPFDRRESLFGFFFIEFLKDTPWEIENAYEYIQESFSMIRSHGYSETVWIDNIAYPNDNYDTYQYEDLPYCPAIDGY